jgi:putative ABC transport system permease protein
MRGILQEQVKETYRNAWIFVWIERFYADFKLAVRSMMKSPGFTATAVMSLAIAICINATIFSILDAVFLRPKGFKDPATIVSLDPNVSFADYSELQAQCHTLSAMTAERHIGLIFNTPVGGTSLHLEIVEPNYFSVLGIGAAFGSIFTAQDPRLAKEPVAVISYSLWQSRFGSDSGIVGKQIHLDYRPYTVIGVAQKGYNGSERFPKADLWLAANPSYYLKRPNLREFRIVGRLRPGVSPAQVKAEMDILIPRLGLKNEQTRNAARIRVHTEKWTDENTTIAKLIQPFVGLVLVVACMNISGLLLSRNEERRREVAMRLALGAGRGQLVRQFLVESFGLATLGGGLGLLLTFWASTALPNLLPVNLRFLAPTLQINDRITLFTTIITGMATLMFGLGPAIRASRTNVWSVMKRDDMNARPRAGRLLGRNALVISQVAISAVFLVVTGLMVCACLRANSADLGFQRKNLLYVMPSEDLRGMEERRFMERVRSLPGVEEVSVAQQVPMYLYGQIGSKMTISSSSGDLAKNPEGQLVVFNPVSTNYFEMMGIPLLRGRTFNARDAENAPNVAILSESMARRYWPNGDAIGRFLRTNQPGATPIEIVGLVGDVVEVRVGKPPDPILYLPRSQSRHAGMILILKSKDSVQALLASLRQEMHLVKKNFEPFMAETQDSVIRFGIAPQRALAWLFGILGVSAFAMGMAGLYSVVSFSMARRTHELGIRMALGSQAGATLWMVLRKGLILALLGLITGLPIAFMLGEIMSEKIFGISPMDPSIFVFSSVLVLAVTLLASYIPARRAARINPMEAMRCE